MRLTSTAFTIAILLPTGTDAFLLPHASRSFTRHPSSSVLTRMVGQGWDNEDFLEALSGKGKELEEANEQYRKQSRYTPQEEGGTEAKEGGSSEDADEEGEGPSDELLRKMGLPPGTDPKQVMEERKRAAAAAQEQKQQAPPPQQPPQPPQDPYAQQQQQPYQQQPPPQQYPPQYPPSPPQGYPQDPYAQQQQPPPPYPPQDPYAQQQPQQQGMQPPPPYPPYDPYNAPQQRPPRPDPRPQGRNRDADAIQNTADVYFAQLKRDSTIRTLARDAGDLDKANDPFADESVVDMKDMLQTNPHLQSEQEREAEFASQFTTSEDEMLLPTEWVKEKPKSYSGVSYKEKLKAMKEKKKGGAAVEEEKAASTETPPGVMDAEVEAASPPSPPAPEKSVAVVKTEPQAQPVPAEASVPAEPPKSEDDIRRQIRTLQGLLLKHRGGPGFGHGRLKEPEWQRLIDMLRDVTALLRSEVGLPRPEGAATVEEPVEKATVYVKPAVPQPRPAATATPPAEAATVGPSAVPPTATGSSVSVPPPAIGEEIPPPLAGAFACIDAALMLYKSSPASSRPGLLEPVRTALLSAVNTMNQIMAESGVQAQPQASVAPPVEAPDAEQALTGAFACVDAALTLYKSSPASSRQALLEPVRMALLSAISTMSQVMAEPDTQEQGQAPQAPAVTPPPAVPEQEEPMGFGFPSSYAVTQPDEEEVAASAGSSKPQSLGDVIAESAPSLAEGPPSLDDPNSEVLRNVYGELENASGDGGKYGLKGDLDPAEAEKLADSIAEMRGVLMEELDSGIPQPTAPAGAAEIPESSGASSSKYQQMLAKAKAAKAAKKGQ